MVCAGTFCPSGTTLNNVEYHRNSGWRIPRRVEIRGAGNGWNGWDATLAPIKDADYQHVGAGGSWDSSIANVAYFGGISDVQVVLHCNEQSSVDRAIETNTCRVPVLDLKLIDDAVAWSPAARLSASETPTAWRGSAAVDPEDPRVASASGRWAVERLAGKGVCSRWGSVAVRTWRLSVPAEFRGVGVSGYCVRNWFSEGCLI